MKIDGYTPPDKKVATEIGVELEYNTKYGDIHIRAKSSGRENTEFRAASDKLTQKNALRAKTGQEVSPEQSMKEYIGLWYDTIIISWATTITSGGKKIESTRENFIELLIDDNLVKIFTALIDDCANAENFQKQVDKETVKNS